MTGLVHWRDAEAAAGRLTDGDRGILSLLARLPLLWEGAIERLNGLRGGASVYRRLVRLREAGLIDEIHPALRAGRNPGLLYLTDLGISMIAVDRQLEPVHLARRTRLRRPDLLARLPGLPHLLAAYQLLVALAGTGAGQADLLAWENPWRRRVRRPTRKAPITVEFPAYAVLAWDDQAADFILVPDLATFPLRVYRPSLGQLLETCWTRSGPTPTLVVATTQARRCTWMRLLDDLARSRGDTPLLAHVTTWRNLRDGTASLGHVPITVRPSTTFPIREPMKGGDALLEWRNAAACSRRRVRPDGYAMVRLAGRLHGFFLEYDRGTMGARDYSEKWARYYDYRDSRAFELDYDGFPTILVVTTDNTAEERIARFARSASVGRPGSLPILLTCEWRISNDPANRDGLLGSVWRTPDDSGRQRWPGRT